MSMHVFANHFLKTLIPSPNFLMMRFLDGCGWNFNPERTGMNPKWKWALWCPRRTIIWKPGKEKNLFGKQFSAKRRWKLAMKKEEVVLEPETWMGRHNVRDERKFNAQSKPNFQH